MKIKSIITKWLLDCWVKKHDQRHLIIYKPCMYNVSPKAIVEIDKFRFNMQWDDKRIIDNKIVGSLYVAKNAMLKL